MKRAIFALVLVGLAWMPAGAQEDWACKGDVEAFCKDVKPGEGRLIKCLKEHEGSLSAGCKEQQAKHREGAKQAMQACEADKEQFCKDVQPGEGRIIDCMKAHEAQLSSGCREVMAKGKAEHEKRKMERKEHKAGMK